MGTAAAAEEGLVYADKISRQPNTTDCHRLILWADETGNAPQHEAAADGSVFHRRRRPLRQGRAGAGGRRYRSRPRARLQSCSPANRIRHRRAARRSRQSMPGSKACRSSFLTAPSRCRARRRRISLPARSSGAAEQIAEARGGVVSSTPLLACSAIFTSLRRIAAVPDSRSSGCSQSSKNTTFMSGRTRAAGPARGCKRSALPDWRRCCRGTTAPRPSGRYRSSPHWRAGTAP